MYLYDKHKGSSPGISGLCIVALMQSFNLLSIFWVAEFLFREKFDLSKIAGVILLAILLFLNGIHFNRQNYTVLKERWKNEDENARLKRGAIVLTYVLLSTVICIGLAIYLGGKKW